MNSHLRHLRATSILSLAGVLGFGSIHVGLAASGTALSALSVVPNASWPGGDALLRQSFSAMARSVHALHSEVRTREETRRLHATLRVSGDCAMTSTSHRGRVWERGTKLAFNVVPINMHFIGIGSTTGAPRIWRRTADTGNRWRIGAQPGREEDTAVLFLNACPLQLLFALRATDRPRFTNLGPARIRGFETWHLHAASSSNSTTKGVYGSSDLYIERRTLRWIRSSSVNHSPGYRERESIDYSKFNESVTISPPRVGSSTPWGLAAAPALHLGGPLFAAVDRLGNLFVADFGPTRQRIVKVNRLSGALVNQWLTPAVGVAVDGQGHVYTTGAFGVTEYTPAGKALATWGAPSAPAQQLIRLEGIAAGADGTTYVADAFRHRILKYTPNHTLIARWTMQAARGDETAGPNGIAVDGAGHVFVADCGHHQVLKYSSGGKVIGSWTLQGSRPHLFGGFGLGGIALDSEGNIYVADRYTDTVVKLSPAGSVLARMKGTGAGKLIRPYGVAVDSMGDIYVTVNFGSQARIVKLSAGRTLIAVWR